MQRFFPCLKGKYDFTKHSRLTIIGDDLRETFTLDSSMTCIWSFHYSAYSKKASSEK